jgi:HTH-type transcriptional regulator, sugar sensing transcriptional regulator
MNIELLEKMGLTKGEIKVYLALIELGSTTAGAVIKKADMQRSAVYFCLDSLIKKGLVGYVVKNNRKHFEANKPESLFDLLKEKEKEIIEQERELKNFVPLLFEKKELLQKAQQVKIYEGWKGVLNSYSDALELLNTGDESFAFSPTTDENGANLEQIRNLIAKVRLERKRKKIKLKIVMSEDLKNTIGKDQESTPDTEVRYLPKSEINPATVNVYGSTAIIVLWTKIPLSISIRSKEVAISFKNYFNLIWKQAKP